MFHISVRIIHMAAFGKSGDTEARAGNGELDSVVADSALSHAACSIGTGAAPIP
ncbi:hypothetical protein ACFL0B_04690 [Thermodesulfobacteriota bacterium]|jgi:hypothetical protein|nr:hypothetical protein [Desulfobulbaceae bacterium]